MKFNEFLKECREKDIFKNLSIYLVSSWLLLQVISVTWEPMGLPKSTLTYLLLFLLLGFPLYLYLLWRLRIKKLRITPDEDPRTPVKGKRASSKSGVEISSEGAVDVEETKYRRAFRQTYFSLLLAIGAIVIFAATLIVKANFFNQQQPAVSELLPTANADKLAVLPFENNTSDPELDVVGKMAVDWIMHGITQHKMGQVISPKIIEDYSNVIQASVLSTEDNIVLKEYLKPSRVIVGTYYLQDGQMLINCSLMDSNLDKTLISFEVASCDPESPLVCIEALKQRILGYLATQEDDIADFEETPPSYEAYQYYLEAQSQDDNTDTRYLDLLNMAIAKDPSFFKPKAERLIYYYNIDDFKAVDSLYRQMSEQTNLNKRQNNLLDLYDALLKGDNRLAYKYFLEEYSAEPFDLANNSTAMVLALQYVNRPEDLESIYKEISMEEMDLDRCLYCSFRNYTMALALMDLGRIQETEALLAPYKGLSGHALVKEAIIRTAAIAGNTTEVDQLLNEFKLSDDLTNWSKLTLWAAKEFLRSQKSRIAQKYFDLLTSELEPQYTSLSKANKAYLREAYYYQGKFDEAQKYFDRLDLKDLNPEELAYYAVCLHKNGAENKAKNVIATLEMRKGAYQYGQIDYHLAQFRSAIGDRDAALSLLLKAVAAGNRYTPDTYVHDLHFMTYVDQPDFEAIMSYWH